MIGKQADSITITNATLALLLSIGAVSTSEVAAETNTLARAAVDTERSALGSRWAHARPRAAESRRLKRMRAASIRIKLDDLSDLERYKALPNGKDRPLKIGLSREIPTGLKRNLNPDLVWSSVAGGHVSAFTVTSPGAKALRLALAISGGHPDAEFRFFEKHGERQVAEALTPRLRKVRDSDPGSVGGRVDGGHRLWSPVIKGDTASIEVFLPAGADRNGFEVKVSGLSHLLSFGRDWVDKETFVEGPSGSCNVDVACRETSPGGLPDAVARLVFTQDGATFLCTGTLLRDRDPDSKIAYVATADHCINKQSVAETVESFWFLQRPACESPDAIPIVRRSLGGDLLGNDPDRDFSLLQLNDELPSGVFYANWSSDVVELGSELVTIHHPGGDVKKLSRGAAAGLGAFLQNGGNSGDYIQVVWSVGTTEPGSSGSGLFDSEGRYRGILSGGFASCSLRTAPDWFGRFDLALPTVKRWLKKTPPNLKPFKTAKAAAEQGEWLEYKLLVPKEITRLDVGMSGLSGAADLYVRANSRPNKQSFDCAPKDADKEDERCVLENQGATTYYLGVRGTGSQESKLRLNAALLNENAASGVGVFDPSSDRVYQRFVLAREKRDRRFKLKAGGSDWIPLSGDVNNDGIHSVSAFDPGAGEFHLWNSNGSNAVVSVVQFGPDGGAAVPLLGDWDGDGTDTVGVYIPDRKVFELRNSNDSGKRDLRYRFGRARGDWLPIVGDWNGDGVETPGFYVPDERLFRLFRGSGKEPKFKKVRFGSKDANLVPVVGDWTGDTHDTVGLYDPVRGKFSLRYSNTNSQSGTSIRFGPKNGIPIAGKWMN